MFWLPACSYIEHISARSPASNLNIELLSVAIIDRNSFRAQNMNAVVLTTTVEYIGLNGCINIYVLYLY